METNEFEVTPEKLKGKTLDDVFVSDSSVVIKFTDGTFLDVYLDIEGKRLKTQTNKLEV